MSNNTLPGLIAGLSDLLSKFADGSITDGERRDVDGLVLEAEAVVQATNALQVGFIRSAPGNGLRPGEELLIARSPEGGVFGIDASWIDQVADEPGDTVMAPWGAFHTLEEREIEVPRQAVVRFSAADIQSADDELDDDEAQAVLDRIAPQIESRLVELGNEVIEDLVAIDAGQ